MREPDPPLPGGGADLGDHPRGDGAAAPAGGGGAKSATGPAGPETLGDLAIVLHSHMPYVEGFGTYPFGEEWLFDAVIRSYLPVLEVARDLTMTVTPVLADQLEDAGVRERLRSFPVDWGICPPPGGPPQVPPRGRPPPRAGPQR